MQLLNYKLSELSIEMRPYVGLLHFRPNQSKDIWKFSYSIPPIVHLPAEDLFIVSFAMRTQLQTAGDMDVHPGEEQEFVDCRGCVSGLFRFVEEVSEETRNKMLKYNATAILLPYLRAGLTNILAQAGFGCILPPILNIKEMVDKHEVLIETLGSR